MKISVPLLLLLCLSVTALPTEENVTRLKQKLNAVFHKLTTCTKPPGPDYNLGSLWNYFSPGTRPSPRDTCLSCKESVVAVLEAYHAGVPPEVIRDVVLFNCKAFHIRSDTVCDGVVDMSYEPMLYIVQNTENLTSDRVCAIVHQGSHCGADDPNLDWSVDIAEPVAKSRVLPRQKSILDEDPLHILQLTDIHYDPDYVVGSNAECIDGFCCRQSSGDPSSPSAAAGRWGDYRPCDIPWEVLTDTLEHVKTQHQKIDYVYFTGDIIDHATWATSREKNSATLTKVMNELKRSFGDIPVFPIIGNHEIHPFNLYTPVSVTEENVSSAWLYELLADLWSPWLPDDTKETILRGGFYTVVVRPGFRVVVLNNNHCYTDNWWLIYHNQDPDGQLQWLSDVLQEAETSGEVVHLLYHIPTGGSDCYKRWSREFTRLVNRYQKIIKGQFSGHTHNDEFRVFYSSDDPKRPIAVVHVGGSLTPFTYINGNYRMYTVDANTMDILDYETWIFNLTASNLSPADKLPWEKMYSFTEAYGGEAPTPGAVDAVARRMVEDAALVQQYFRFFNLNGDPQLEKGCDADCEEQMVCSVVTADSNDLSHCEEAVEAVRARKSG